MAWSYVGQTGITASSASGNITPGDPSGSAAGDLMVATISYRGNAAFTVPAGWTLVAQESSGNTSSNGISSVLMAFIVRGASGPSRVFTRTGGGQAYAKIVTYRSDAGGTISLDTFSSNTLGSNSTTASTGSLTTSVANQLIVAAWAADGNSSHSNFDAATDPATQSSGTDTTNAPSAGTWRRRWVINSGVAGSASGAEADALRATAGATGTITGLGGASNRGAMVAATFLESSSTNATATPGAGSLTLTGQAPTVSASSSASPGVASLAITGFAPTVSVSSDVTAAPGSGALTLTGFAPTASAGASATPGAGSLSLTGFAPDASASVSAAPGTGALTTTGFAPDVQVDAPPANDNGLTRRTMQLRRGR